MQKCHIQKPERLKLNTLYSVLIKDGGVINGSLTVIVIAVGNKTIFNKKKYVYSYFPYP